MLLTYLRGPSLTVHLHTANSELRGASEDRNQEEEKKKGG